MSSIHENQVRLLVSTLPTIAKIECFALKGGTAINLFHFDMPRLSVDVDLVYLPVEGREESLRGISHGLDRMAAGIEKLSNVRSVDRKSGGADARLFIRGDRTTVKIETSPVGRGTLRDPTVMEVSETVKNTFGFARMKVVSEVDLFAGKMVAAFDRQHPRDVFDMMHYRAGREIDDALLNAFLAYAACSRRPLHEVLFPNMIDVSERFFKEFAGMARRRMELDELLTARADLFAHVQSRIDETRIAAMRSVVAATPNLSGIDMERARELPAFRWKQENLIRLRESDPDKFAMQETALIEAWESTRSKSSEP